MYSVVVIVHISNLLYSLMRMWITMYNKFKLVVQKVTKANLLIWWTQDLIYRHCKNKRIIYTAPTYTDNFWYKEIGDQLHSN